MICNIGDRIRLVVAAVTVVVFNWVCMEGLDFEILRCLQAPRRRCLVGILELRSQRQGREGGRGRGQGGERRNTCIWEFSAYRNR